MLFMRLRGKAGKITGRDSEKSERIQGSWNIQSRDGFCASIPKLKDFCNKNKGFEIDQVPARGCSPALITATRARIVKASK